MKKKLLIPIISGSAALALTLALSGLVGYSSWQYHQPKFHDLTIELVSPCPRQRTF